MTPLDELEKLLLDAGIATRREPYPDQLSCEFFSAQNGLDALGRGFRHHTVIVYFYPMTAGHGRLEAPPDRAFDEILRVQRAEAERLANRLG